MPTEKEQIEAAKELLLQNGFRLNVGGCGCCSSPWVFLSYQGEPIIYDEDPKGNVTDRDCVSITMDDTV